MLIIYCLRHTTAYVYLALPSLADTARLMPVFATLLRYAA